MDVEQKSEGGAPFQEECNTKQFFVGGGRGAILSDIKKALEADIDLVTLIGDEGSGKTMLCKMLQEQWQTHHRILFLPQIVESFEDVVRVTAQECGVDYPLDTNRSDARKIFLNIVATLRARGESLLLVCDEAEKMYLATLERIRKVVDDVNGDGGGLQLLLAGRKSLRSNLEQLGLCNFESISEKQFFLSVLDDHETWSYLNYCVQASRGDEQEVFTKEASSKIASMGRGNLRLINVYADESLRSSNADTSFLVLLDHVNDDGAEPEVPVSPGARLSQFSWSPRYLIGGGAVLFVLLMVLIFSGDEEEKVVIVPVISETNPVFSGTSLEPTTVTPAEEVVVVEVPQEVQEVPPPEPVLEQTVEPVETIVEEELVVPPAQYRPLEISPVEIVEKPGVAASPVPQIIVAEKGKRLVSPRAEVEPAKVRADKPSTSSLAVSPENGDLGDPVLGGFLSSGVRWKAGEMDSSFSIQLMSLKSDQAETNLKRIVSQADYQDVADKLVILRKPSVPPAFLVFYGVYPSMAAARNARNNMPIFLRDRYPYPVSVRGAVEKAREE
jgi:type II secretory pathway predicted ATPase ExeA/septal ring-binding cell division protein DamX